MQEDVAPSRDRSAAFTLREAAAVLGISLNTLRRRIAAGQIRAERVQRPQGHVWQVHLHGAATQEHRADSTVPLHGAVTVQQPPAALAQAEAMATYTRSLLDPLVTRMAEQEGIIRELERENGRLSAENRALEAHTAPQNVETTKEAPAPWWRTPDAWITPAVATVVLALVTIVLTLSALR
jgi:excisionase family DNA binding protein